MVLPAWVPSDALAIGLFVLIGATLLMNRGRWWFTNVLAQDEPLLLAIGTFVIVATAEGWFSDVLGAGGDGVWLAIGGVLAGVALLSRYTSVIEIDGLI